MEAKAIYIPQLGKTFFIEEIESISDIEIFKKEFGFFKIKFKYGKKKTIKNYKIGQGEEDIYYHDRFELGVLESIRNEFLKYINIINNQKITEKQLKFTEEEYNLICKGLNLLGINSGRVFYVLNRSVINNIEETNNSQQPTLNTLD
jgi:hypothetical protein